MFDKWRMTFFAVISAIRNLAKGNITLTPTQMHALIELQACHLLRLEELAKLYPDLSFSLHLLCQDGADWEWFPKLHEVQSQGLEPIQHFIQQDISMFPFNYEVISYDVGTSFGQSIIQLSTPGIRRKSNKEAIVKAKISLYNSKTAIEQQSLIQDLNEL